MLRTGCFPRRAAFQGGHEIDDGWRGRDLPGFNGEPLHLGFEQFSQGLLVTISIRRRIETSGPLRDDRLLEGERLRESFEIKKAAGEGTRMRTLRVLAATAGVRPTRRWREPDSNL